MVFFCIRLNVQTFLFFQTRSDVVQPDYSGYKTGKIENAARCSVRNHGTTGIRPNLVQEQKKTEGIYDMQGRKVNGKPHI